MSLISAGSTSLDSNFKERLAYLWPTLRLWNHHPWGRNIASEERPSIEDLERQLVYLWLTLRLWNCHPWGRNIASGERPSTEGFKGQLAHLWRTLRLWNCRQWRRRRPPSWVAQLPGGDRGRCGHLLNTAKVIPRGRANLNCGQCCGSGLFIFEICTFKK